MRSEFVKLGIQSADFPVIEWRKCIGHPIDFFLLTTGKSVENIYVYAQL